MNPKSASEMPRLLRDGVERCRGAVARPPSGRFPAPYSVRSASVLHLTGLLIALGAVPAATLAGPEWRLFEQTSIAGRISGSIKKGHIFKTASGRIYEVTDYVYLYEYEYHPDVIVLSDGSSYKLIIEGFDKPLLCRCLNCPSHSDQSPGEAAKERAPEADLAIESHITSEFDGLDHGNIYKLANGQIWEQTEYWIWAWVWFNPRVLIWKDRGTYRMRVEGIDHPVAVKRIK